MDYKVKGLQKAQENKTVWCQGQKLERTITMISLNIYLPVR